MSTEDLKPDENSNHKDGTEPKSRTYSEKELAAKIKESVADAIKNIKVKLDHAYESRDAALAKIGEFEAREKEAELKRLQEEGKFKEAFELQLAEERSKREAVERRNIELTRDMQLRQALSGHEFRNERAMTMAQQELVSQLVRDDKGEWVHKSGKTIQEAVQAFVEDDNNGFLMKVRQNNGAGSPPTKPAGAPDKQSLFSMTQAEVLKRAQEGKL